MRTITLANAREELHWCRIKGAKRGETKRDEVEAMGPASASMLFPLTLLNRCKSGGSISPSNVRRFHTNQIHTAVGVAAPRVEVEVLSRSLVTVSILMRRVQM